MNEYPKVGDTIMLRKNRVNKTEIEYSVLQVDKWDRNGPLTAENHGVFVLKKMETNHPSIKETIQFYCLYNWDKNFYIAKNEQEKLEDKKYQITPYMG